MKPIREAVKTELLKAELTAERFLRVTRKGENEIYVVNCHNSPNVLEEIGRLLLNDRTWDLNGWMEDR